VILSLEVPNYSL